MEKNKKFRTVILTTGGTIEKSYDEFDGSLANKDTILNNEIISRLRLPHSDIEIHKILNKDSLYFEEADRGIVLENIEFYQTQGEGMVVIHGTDTMAQTAKFCYERLKDPKVAIVFTGAMKPLGFYDSDARQNVIEALLASKVLAPGFYISFHGRVYNVPNVRKNRERGTFEAF